MTKGLKAAICFSLSLLCVIGFDAHAATLLDGKPAANARVVRLESAARAEDRGHLVVTAFALTGKKHVDVYLADRDDAPFQPIGRIDDPQFGSGACCGTLYELPQAVGTLRKGTLLWAASVGQNAPDRRMTIKIYRSDDEGRTWSYLSQIKSPNQGGLWEPEFAVDRAGELVMFYSDETQHGEHSQMISKVRSNDGLTWRDLDHVVASRIQSDRPGMPVVHRLVDGRWMMSYELGGAARFITYYRLSEDGWNWGDPSYVGSEIRLPNGAFPAHAPRFTVMADGAILLVGQLIETRDLQLGARNGRVLLVNKAGNPATPWQTVPAPVPVPDACSESCPSHQWCPNYSSALLPSENGAQVLEFASEWTDGKCLTSYAWAPWRRPGPQAGMR